MRKYINIAEQKLIDSIKKKECVFFVGSGISKFKPTSLPDGSELKSILLNSLDNQQSNIIEPPLTSCAY